MERLWRSFNGSGQRRSIIWRAFRGLVEKPYDPLSAASCFTSVSHPSATGGELGSQQTGKTMQELANCHWQDKDGRILFSCPKIFYLTVSAICVIRSNMDMHSIDGGGSTVLGAESRESFPPGRCCCSSLFMSVTHIEVSQIHRLLFLGTDICGCHRRLIMILQIIAIWSKSATKYSPFIFS